MSLLFKKKLKKLYNCCTLSVRVGQSAHEYDVVAFFDDEQERMTCMELNGLDIGRIVRAAVRDELCGCTEI